MQVRTMKKLTFSLFTVVFFAAFADGQTEIEPFLKKSDALQSERKFEEAVTEIGKALALQPNDAELYLMRANLHRFTGNKQELIADVQKAIALKPNDKKILYRGAQLIFRGGDYQQSLSLTNALIALGDPDLPALELRISNLTHLEDFAAALEEITKALKLFPNEERLRHNQSNLIRLTGDSDGAQNGFSAQIAALEAKLIEAKLSKIENEEAERRMRWDLSVLFFSRANIYQSKFETEKMKADLIKAVEYHPIAVHFERRAVFYIKQKMYNEALADLNKAIEMDSDGNDGFYLRRGDVFFYLQKYAEAIKDFEHVVKQKNGLEELAERRILLAKQKVQQNGVSPK